MKFKNFRSKNYYYECYNLRVESRQLPLKTGLKVHYYNLSGPKPNS